MPHPDGIALVPADALAAARGSLCAQITRMEVELSELVAGAFERASADLCASMRTTRATDGPRLLDLGALERVRDDLVHALAAARASRARRAEQQRETARLLERMRRDPAAYRGVRVRDADLGVGGCGVWEVRPRLGLIGMLAGWWEVKLSSGCP